jgi:hypothetical protein
LRRVRARGIRIKQIAVVAAEETARMKLKIVLTAFFRIRRGTFR